MKLSLIEMPTYHIRFKKMLPWCTRLQWIKLLTANERKTDIYVQFYTEIKGVLFVLVQHCLCVLHVEADEII